MCTGKIECVCGSGSGKTALALGRGIEALGKGKHVIVIQFLKGNSKSSQLDGLEPVLQKLEPEMKVFRFEKSDRYFEELTEEQKQEEFVNIRNGLNYAKKVLTTGECDLLILDEVLGLVDQKLVTEEDLLHLLECRGEAEVLLTGKILPEKIREISDHIVEVEQVPIKG